MIVGAAILALTIAGARTTSAQYNHVVVKDFRWKIRSTAHFDIYYYEGSAALVPHAAEILEKAFATVPKKLGIAFEPPVWASKSARRKARWKRRPFFLYASPNDFEQSNIAQVGDGTGGITEPFKNRFMVYNNGEAQWLDEVITHEFTHIMQYYVLISGFWKTGKIIKTIVYPLWMMEGQPDWVTDYAEPAIEESLVRDAATSDGLIPLTKLEHFGHLKPHQITLAYHEGAEAIEFIADQYGQGKVGDMLKLFDTALEINQVLGPLVGLDIFQFDAKFREYETAKYARVARRERLREPEFFGEALTHTSDDIPQFNTSPVFSPDFKTMYYVTTKSDIDPPQVWEMDLRSGRARKLPHVPYTPIENIPMGNFANLSRILSISRDGRRLVFAGTKNHQDAIFLYDTKDERLLKIALPAFQTINQPAISPDGSLVAFSGMKDGFTDIYTYDLNTGRVENLTQDPNDDQMPTFAPDGRSIVYSSEIGDPLHPYDFQRRLFRLDLRDHTETELENCGAQARDPVVSTDATHVLFVRDDGHFSEIDELDLATGRVAQRTRSLGASFTPAYGPDGQIAFAALRRGNVHIYMGPRSDFLDEPLPQVSPQAPDPAKFSLPGMGAVAPSTATVAIGPARDYHFDFSTDLFIPALFYSSIGGFFSTEYWQGSDMTGNHQASALADLSGSDYDYQATYSYARFRPQLVGGVSGYSYHDLVDSSSGHSYNQSEAVEFGGVSYPFDRYHSAQVTLASIEDRVVDTTDGTLSGDYRSRAVSASLVRDTTFGRYLVVTNGDRASVSLSQYTPALGGNQSLSVFSTEYDQFLPVASQTAFAARLAYSQTGGPNQVQLMVGGLGGVRGYARSTDETSGLVGNRLAIATAEFRFPIVRELNYYMWWFFPDFYFKAIFGTLFTDTGFVGNSEGDVTTAAWSKLENSVGLGLRVYTFVLQDYEVIVSMDYARRTTSRGGIFYVYPGLLF